MENDDPFAATQKIIDDFHDALLEWYRALVRGMTDALRSKGSSTSHQDFPLLGLATTRELLEEVAARMAIQASPGGKRLMYQCQAALSNLHSQVLDYRTVDNM